MTRGETSSAYLRWRECLKDQKKLRKELALPRDDREDKKMCVARFKKYFDSIQLKYEQN
jgi:hypothetical protein